MLKRNLHGATLAMVIGATTLSVPARADVAYVSNEKGGVSVVDLATLKVTKDIDVGGTTPRGIGVTADGAYIVTANKGTNDMSVIDAKTGTIVRRIPLGPSPEFLRVYRNLVFVTYEPSSSGPPGPEKPAAEKPAAKGGKADDDDDKIPAEIAIVDPMSGKILRSIKSGIETEGIEFTPDGTHIITTNEGDETLSIDDVETGRHVRTVSTREIGRRPRGIVATPDRKGYVVTFESSSSMALLDDKFALVKSVPTKTGPNGVTYDPTGSLLVVAAARASTLQFFDAKTLMVVKEVPIGSRCWHFTYTADGGRILVACGRSDDLQVINTKDYTLEAKVSGLKLPWGVVTFPKGHGTLDAP